MITDKAERRIIYLILLELFNIPSTVKNAKIIKEILPIILNNVIRFMLKNGTKSILLVISNTTIIWSKIIDMKPMIFKWNEFKKCDCFFIL